MARKNRLVIGEGVYHITSRIANQEFLLRDPQFKDDIVTWIYGIADFSGINVLSWCIMNNHFHLLVHMPSVPERYWTNPDTPPTTSAFTMRPRENRAPRWTPDITDTPDPITPAGDCPSQEAITQSIADGIPLVILPRAKTGFMLSDEEMIKRLKRLEDGRRPKSVKAKERHWATLRKVGRDDEVEAEKEAYCRRMYNVSQFMKTLKQRISQKYNVRYGHEGQLWSGRFYSGLVENEQRALATVAAYIDWNPVRANLANHPRNWEWCSFRYAVGAGPLAEKARKGYEQIFGCDWEEARSRMESIFSGKLPENHKPIENCNTSESSLDERILIRISEHIKTQMPEISKGDFISCDPDFGKRILSMLPEHFPGPSKNALSYFALLDWSLPENLAPNAQNIA